MGSPSRGSERAAVRSLASPSTALTRSSRSRPPTFERTPRTADQVEPREGPLVPPEAAMDPRVAAQRGDPAVGLQDGDAHRSVRRARRTRPRGVLPQVPAVVRVRRYVEEALASRTRFRPAARPPVGSASPCKKTLQSKTRRVGKKTTPVFERRGEARRTRFAFPFGFRARARRCRARRDARRFPFAPADPLFVVSLSSILAAFVFFILVARRRRLQDQGLEL